MKSQTSKLEEEISHDDNENKENIEMFDNVQHEETSDNNLQVIIRILKENYHF